MLLATAVPVTSPKTEHHPGGESRVIPMFPELKPYLLDVFVQAEPGTTYVITQYRRLNTNLRTELLRMMDRAGVAPWPKLFHNMRSSRQTELADVYPIQVVCEWMGNSEVVARENYLQMLDAHYERAARETTELPLQKAAQNPAQQSPAAHGTGSQTGRSEMPCPPRRSSPCR